MINRIINAIKRRLKPSLRKEEEFKNWIKWIDFQIIEETESIFLIGNKDFKNIWLRKNSSDLDVFEQIFLHKEYEPLVLMAKDNHIQVKQIIDAGANIGLASLYFLNAFPSAKIVAIEPDIDNYNMLLQNTQEDKHRITCLQKAIWNTNQPLELHSDFRDGRAWSKSVRKSEIQKKSTIQGISITELLNDQSLTAVDIFKMDIEGAEEVVFSKNENASFLEHIKILGLEIHNQQTIRTQIVDILKKSGFFIAQFRETTIGVNTNKIRL